MTRERLASLANHIFYTPKDIRDFHQPLYMYPGLVLPQSTNRIWDDRRLEVSGAAKVRVCSVRSIYYLLVGDRISTRSSKDYAKTLEKGRCALQLSLFAYSRD